MTGEKTTDSAASALSAGLGALLPCPFCGGPVTLEQSTEQYSREHGQRQYWGVVCRNVINLGGSCCIEQIPSASKEAAVARWNMRNGQAPNKM
jgi:hypothetical protein